MKHLQQARVNNNSLSIVHPSMNFTRSCVAKSKFSFLNDGMTFYCDDTERSTGFFSLLIEFRATARSQ